MKTLGVNWTRANVLVLLGVIAGISIIPAVAFLVPGEFAPNSQEFSRAASQDLNPHDSTCLDDSTQVIPAGVAVCTTLHGFWRDGVGPLGRHDHEMMAIWTRQAHPPFLVLTSPHPYQHPDWSQESIDSVVCVQPPGGAERALDIANRMQIDVVRSSSADCAGAAAHP
jgi:hypothetical protein